MVLPIVWFRFLTAHKDVEKDLGDYRWMRVPSADHHLSYRYQLQVILARSDPKNICGLFLHSALQ